MLSRNPYLSAVDVEDILFASAIEHGAAGYDTLFGHGVVNARAALDATPAFATSGLGLAGTAGVPLLVGIGNLYAGTLNEINLSDAKPNALAAIVLAASNQPVGFKGGTLYPGPFLPPTLVTSSPTGAIDLPFVMPAGVPSGELWVQWAIADQGALYGVALSNAIVGYTP